MRRLASGLFALAVAVGVPTAAQALHASAPDSPASARVGGGGASFTLQPSLGLVGGKATELVFYYPLGAKYKLSELTWDIGEVVTAGLEASVAFGGRVRLCAGLWSARTEGDGMMVDRDWLYPEELTPLFAPTDDNWTDESRHPDTTLDEGTVLDVNLSTRVLESGAYSLSGILGLTWQRWGWSARGGTFVYSYESLRDTTGDFEDYYGEDVRVIEYEQQITIPYVGLGLARQGPALRVDGHVLLSPVVFASDRDDHVLRETVFEGDFNGGLYFAAGVNGSWTFAPRWYATLALDYQSISEITGDVTKTSAIEGNAKFKDGGGFALNAAMASLGIGLRF